MSQDIAPIQKRIPKILQNVQILFQNQFITADEKNNIVSLLSNARKTSDTTELHKLFKKLFFRSPDQFTIDIVQELLDQTAMPKVET